MFVVKFQKQHGFTAFTFQWVITKGMENGCAPLIKTTIKMMFFAGDGTVEMLVDFTVPGVKAAIADHFKELLRNMAN